MTLYAGSPLHSPQLILQNWKKRFGPRLEMELTRIANNSQESSFDRYAAISGTALYFSKNIPKLCTPLIKNKDWLVRSACLKAATRTAEPFTLKTIGALLHDPALIVKSEALSTLLKFTDTHAKNSKFLEPIREHWVSVLADPENYHPKQPPWIIQTASHQLKQDIQKRPLSARHVKTLRQTLSKVRLKPYGQELARILGLAT